MWAPCGQCETAVRGRAPSVRLVRPSADRPGCRARAGDARRLTAAWTGSWQPPAVDGAMPHQCRLQGAADLLENLVSTMRRNVQDGSGVDHAGILQIDEDEQ